MAHQIHVIDLTARFGAYALKRLGHEDANQAESLSLNNILSSGGLQVNWLRPSPKDADWLARICAAKEPGLVLVGPGALTQLEAGLHRASATSALEYLQFLIAPNALLEEALLKTTLARSTGMSTMTVLPGSDPETIWFFLMDQVDKISGALPPSPTGSFQENDMTTNLKQCIDQAMSIDGALAVALVDYRSGMCLAHGGGGMNLDLAAAGNTEVVRAKLKTIDSLGLKKGIEDILITLSDQYHLIRLIPNAQGLFLYLVLDKVRGNLALARYKLTDIERALKV